MIDIKLIRENPELVKENIKKKFQDEKLVLVDEVLELDKASRENKTRADYLRGQRNSISKSIGMLMANKKIENTTKKSNEELVSVFIPKQGRNDTERFVAVNGERILVQTGKTVEVPKRFAEVIKNSEQMAAVSAAYIDANISI